MVARVLEAADIPTLYLGNIFERPEVRDLLALLDLAAGERSALIRAAVFADPALDRAACARLAPETKGPACAGPFVVLFL